MKYIAFLRGINVGKHKVPMAELKSLLENMGFKNVITLLNSGNVILEADQQKPELLDRKSALNCKVILAFPFLFILELKKESIKYWKISTSRR